MVPVRGGAPQLKVDAPTWKAAGERLQSGQLALLSLWGEPGLAHMALLEPSAAISLLQLPCPEQRLPSIGRLHAPAIRLERAMRDLAGLDAEDAADARPWLRHGTPYPFLAAEGESLHQIAVGPVHAGIIEPGHFRFSVNGEIVARLEERLGYVHKGIDALLAGAEIERAAQVAARISGDSTVAYSFAFARAVEAALQIDPPPRAKILRGVMAELERIANHLGDIGAICNDASLSLIHAHCGIFRERVLAAADRAFGHRLMMDRIVPGGVEDAGPGAARGLQVMLDEIEKPFAEIVRLYDDTPSLQDRTCGTGIVGKDLVGQWAAGGHVGRASGRDFDCRRDFAYAPYDVAVFKVPVFTAGDVDARVWVRIREVEQSIALLRHWLANLPSGPVRVELGNGSGEGIAMTEAFRGDVLVSVRIEGGRVARAHARDASWFQWPLLEAAIENNIVADFPLCNKSFNCSYSGHDL
jgi:Ni,Fe-hydrogenase III large subunit